MLRRAHRIARAAALTVASAAVLAGVVSVAAPAAADTPGCVSNAEFDRVRAGMTMARAHAIFDTNGSQYASGPRDQIRIYTPCGEDQGNVRLDLRRTDGVWRVTAKERLGA